MLAYFSTRHHASQIRRLSYRHRVSYKFTYSLYLPAYYKFSGDCTVEQLLKLKIHFYARKQLLISARLSHRNSVCLSVRHTGGSVKNGAS